LHAEAGVSNYAVHPRTGFVYSLGFLLCAGFLLAAAGQLPANNRNLLVWRYALAGLAALFIINLLSTFPYTINHSLNNLHKLADIVLMSAELLMGLFLACVLAESWLILGLFALQAVGMLVVLMTAEGRLHLLFLSQQLTGLVFAALLVAGTAKLTREPTQG